MMEAQLVLAPRVQRVPLELVPGETLEAGTVAGTLFKGCPATTQLKGYVPCPRRSRDTLSAATSWLLSWCVSGL